MANTVAHLMVARRILRENPGLIMDSRAYYLGSIAPDAIESMEGATRDDKKRVHLRSGIKDMEWLEPEQMAIFDRRVREFTSSYILPLPAGRQKDFNIGYLVHLLTDKCNHSTVRQIILGAAAREGLRDGEYSFFYRVVNDLEALDNYLLKEHPGIAGLFEEILGGEVICSLPGFIEKQFIEKSLHWWKNEYLKRIAERRLVYIAEESIEEFIGYAAAEIGKELNNLL